MYRRGTASYDNANVAGAIMIVPGYGSPQSMSEITLANAGTTVDNIAITTSTDRRRTSSLSLVVNGPPAWILHR